MPANNLVSGERSESACSLDEDEKKGKEMDKATEDVLAERKRQIEEEGWTEEHDDEHVSGEMAFAAAAYAVHSYAGPKMSRSIWHWTGWSIGWWKPKNARRDLVRAAALLIAEIDRLDRSSSNLKLSGEQLRRAR